MILIPETRWYVGRFATPVCVMVPFLDDERILLMRQYRYAADDVLWELPAGTLNGRVGVFFGPSRRRRALTASCSRKQVTKQGKWRRLESALQCLAAVMNSYTSSSASTSRNGHSRSMLAKSLTRSGR